MPADQPKLPSTVWLLFLGLLIAVGIGLLGTGTGGISAIPYSQFEQYLNDGKVKQVTVMGDTLRGTLSEPMPDGRTQFSTVTVYRPQFVGHRIEPYAASAMG